jgi:hypothetical protein
MQCECRLIDTVWLLKFLVPQSLNRLERGAGGLIHEHETK